MLPFLKENPDVRGKRVTVMGLGLFGGGVAVSRTLARDGAAVTVTDLKPEEQLAESVKALEGTSVEFHLGGHREEDFRESDLVIVNPGVPQDSPYLKVAIDAGVPLDSEMNLLFKRCRSKTIVGVTGSNGKTTTTALIGEVLKRGETKAWVGGNIGRPLIEHVEEIAPEDIVVLEISSFQLEHLGAIERSPNIAVVMNITPNHLDRHGTMENYIEAKRQIVAYQAEGDTKILNHDDEIVRAFEGGSPSKTSYFSLKESVEGVFAREECMEQRGGCLVSRIDVTGRQLPGWFNLQNMAAANVALMYLDREALQHCEEVFKAFPGVEHRLEFVGEVEGAKVYNDSIATNPESTIAALETLPGPVVLLAGGYDKKLPFDGLAVAMKDRVRVLVLTGQTAGAIEEASRNAGPEILRAPTFDEAVRLARESVKPGETLLFSPACASYDQFRNFAERGRRFKKLVLHP